MGAAKVATVSTMPSPTFGSLRSPPLSTNTLNAWANRVSRNKRSPRASSAPGVPVELIGREGGELSLPEQATVPIKRSIEKHPK